MKTKGALKSKLNWVGILLILDQLSNWVLGGGADSILVVLVGPELADFVAKSALGVLGILILVLRTWFTDSRIEGTA